MTRDLCAICKGPLTARRSMRKTCSVRCRVKLWRNEERNLEETARKWFYAELQKNGPDSTCIRISWWRAATPEIALAIRAGVGGRYSSHPGTISRKEVVRRYRYRAGTVGNRQVTVRKGKVSVTRARFPGARVTVGKRGRR